MFRTRRIVRGSLFALLLGCGGGSSSGTPISVAQMISQLSGGEVKIGTSGAAFMIPPGSLSADTLITANAAAAAASVPSHDTVKGLLYEMGPEGTTFDPPATLTLPLGGKPPGNAAVVISTLTNGQWQDLETTTPSAAGTVAAQVAHFSGFAVRWIVGGTDVGPGPGGVSPCANIPAEACGGVLAGNWKPSVGCFAGEPVNGCDDPNSKFSYDVSLMGEASFTADMTYTLDLPYSVTGRVHAEPACLRVSGFTSCAEVEEHLRANMEDTFPTLWPNTTCTGTAATGCDCTSTATGSFVMAQTGTYTTEGTMFTTMSTGMEPSQPMSYCVDGNNLWVQVNTDSTQPEYLLFTK